jgi:hypothetical protein
MRVFIGFSLFLLGLIVEAWVQFGNGRVRIGTKRLVMNQGHDDKVVLNKYSRIITEPPSQGASQAMLYATGLTPDKIKLPQVLYGLYATIKYLLLRASIGLV